MSVSDRMVLLNDGEIEQIGTAEELYEEPASRFVADFIGDVNTLGGTLHDPENETARIDIEGLGEIEYPSASIVDGTGLADGDAVVVCVRPEDIRIQSTESDTFAVSSRVRNRIYKGDEVSYILDTDVGTLLVNTDAEEFSIGDEVFATWTDEGTHVFAPVEEGEIESSGAGVGGV